MNISELEGLIARNPPCSPPSPSRPLSMQAEALHTSPKARFQSSIRNLNQRQYHPLSLSVTSQDGHRRRHSELELVGSLRVAHRRSRSAQPTVQDTPDFYEAERQAWASPSGLFATNHHARSSQGGQRTTQSRQTPRTFEPLHTIFDEEERPRTSHGDRGLKTVDASSKEENSKAEIAKNEMDEDENVQMREQEAIPDHLLMPARASKFIEGSMNQRCSGTASSWTPETSTESDKPLPPTPVGKHVTFKTTPLRELATASTTKKKERKGLRKSISHLNFHGLSGKMKFFGTSSSTNVQMENRAKVQQQKQASDIELLNERKRKVEEAYAAQFGLKKQRFSGPVDGAAPSPNIGAVHQHLHAAHIAAKTSKPATSALNRLPRKQSRRDLEVENAQLRARLAEQQQAQEQENQPFTPPDSATMEKGAFDTPQASRRRRHSASEAPSVPTIPREGVLQALENFGQKRSWSLSASTSKAGLCHQEEAKQPDDGNNRRLNWEWPDDVF